MAAAQVLGVEIPEEPQPPPLGLEVWAWWQALNQGRQSGMAANPISWADIAAFLSCIGRRAEAWELALLRAIDAAYMRILGAGGASQ